MQRMFTSNNFRIIFFLQHKTKCGHTLTGCVRFFYYTWIHKDRFAEKEEKYHLPIAKKRSL